MEKEKMSKKRLALLIMGLLCIGILTGYVIAEFTLSANFGFRILASNTLTLTWLSDGSTVTSYDFGDMNMKAKSTPWMVIRLTGTDHCNIQYNVTDFTGRISFGGNSGQFSVVPYIQNSSVISDWSNPIPLNHQYDCYVFRLNVQDHGVAYGTYSFTLFVNAVPM
jgi:hypothetical protein